MRVRITPGGRLEGEVAVPGDKSIAHRWLILAATARGSSRLVDLPGSLDVRSTASCLAGISSGGRPALEAWAGNGPAPAEGHGSTWNTPSGPGVLPVLEVQGEGREGLVEAGAPLDCGNSGTTMRLLAGILADRPFASTLTGDASLSVRPMGRVAEPLRMMGAEVETTHGHAPVRIRGGGLHGVEYATPVPSAQVKSAVLLAALGADGRTTVREPAPTRDHTERALLALGARITTDGLAVVVEPFQHEGFEARCPGDPSSAAFLVAAAALTGSELRIDDVGLNPSRMRFLDVMTRMGIETETTVEHQELGEPVGAIHVRPGTELRPIRVSPFEVPLVIDEIPVLALLAAHAPGDSWFLEAGELRVKETDRLAALASGIRALGGHAAGEGDDLVVAGGGLAGGAASSGGDHRMAMAFTVGALAARQPCTIDGIEAADVSFPGFVATLAALGAGLSTEVE